MALVTTFMTSPLLEWTFPKRLIKLDVIEPIAQEVQSNYRILVPIANPTTQKGLLTLAVAIAGESSPSALVRPLSLIELEEDYAFESTPVGANRLIQGKRAQIQQLIGELEISFDKRYIEPIIRVTNDVAKETIDIAQIDRTDLIIVGWHRPTFSGNRLGAPFDVGVFIDRGRHQFNRLLVPYAGSVLDDLSLEIGLRLLINNEARQLTILRLVNSPKSSPELSYELRQVLEQLPPETQSRMGIELIETKEPIKTVI